MIDLSFLTEAEQDAILKVLQRDAELKKVEEDRIRHLQDAADDNELKYKSGQWFYEAKSKRHSDKIHGADLVRASIRKRKKPATIAELGKGSKDKAKKSWVNSVNKDIFIPPELAGVLEEPEEVIEDLKPAKVEKNQSARKVSFLAPDKDKRTLMNGSASPIKPRKNPFNAENAGLDVTDIGDVEHTLENGLELPKPDKMSSKVKFGVKLPYADLNGGSPISLKKTGASLKPAGEPPVPKPRTLLKNDQALDRSSSQAKREDSVNGPEHIYAIVKKQPKIPSTVEIPEYMTPSSREPRFIGQEGTPLEFGKSYGGGGKTNYVPSYPVPSPEHLDVLSEEQPQYYSHKKPGDDKEGLNPQSGNFKVLPIKDRIKTGEVMSNPSEYQNLKSYWNFDGRSPLVQESKPSPGKLHDTILYRSWQTKDLDHKDSKEPSENNLLPNSFDLSEEEQSSHKVATWLAQSSNLYEPLYSEDPGNANEETEDVSSIPKEEEHCPEDLYEKPVVNSVMLESNPPKMDIHEEPPRQVGFIGFEQMENLENQHVAEVIERTAVAKSDNQEFISALQKLEIEASQTEETHEPSVSDASSTQSEEAPSIVEEEITKDTVDTEKNSPDFYNRLLALEEEYKRDPDPEEPEEFATNDIKVSQFPNKEVLISKKVYSSTEFAQPDGILSTDHKKSRSSNMDKERSPLDNYLKSAAKYQTKSPGIYEKNEMGNGLNYKPEIDIPDVPNPNAVILKKGKPAQVAIPHETESFKPDKYSIEVLKAKDESISKVLDWFSRSSESTDETPPINVLESKSEKNGLPFYNRRGVIKTETGTNLENTDPVNVANEKMPNLEAPMVDEEPKAMDRPTSDSNVRVHSHGLNNTLSLMVSLDSLSTVNRDVLNAEVSNVDASEPFGHEAREDGQVIHEAENAEKDVQFQDSENHENCKTEDVENVAETTSPLVEKASVVGKGAVHAEEQTPELNSRAVSTAWRKPGILQKTESKHLPNFEFKESNPSGGGISDQDLGGQISPLRSTISKANDGIDGSRENPVIGDYTEICGKGSLHGSDDGESLFTVSTTCATDGTEQAPELDTEEFSIAWRKPGILENPERPESHEPTVCITDHDLELEGGKPFSFIFSKPALKRDAHVISPSDVLETTEDQGTDSLIDNEDQGKLVTFKKVVMEDEEPSPSISQLRSFWENGRLDSVKERKANNQTKPDPLIIKPTSSTESLKGEEPQDKLSSTNDPNKLRKRHTFHHFFENDGATETNTPCVRSVSVSEGTSQDQSMPKSTFQNVRNFWNFDEKFKVGNVEKLDSPSTIQTRAVGTATLKNKKTILLNDKDIDGLDSLDGVESTKSDMKQNFNQTDPRSEATVSSQPGGVEEKPAENNYSKNVLETTHRLVVPRKVVDLHGMLQKLKNELSEESLVSAEYNLEPTSQNVPLEEFAQVQIVEHAGVEDDTEDDMKGQSSVTSTKEEILEVIDNPILLKPQSSSFSLRLQSLYNEYSKCRTRSGELAGADDRLPSNELSFGGYSTKASMGSLNRSDITDQNISDFLDCKDEACVSSDQQLEMEDASKPRFSETDSPRVSQNQDLALPKLAQPSPPVRKVVSEIVIKSHVPRKGALSEFNIKLRKLRNELVEEHKDESDDCLQNKLDVKDHLSQNDSQNVNEEQGQNFEVKMEKLNPVEIEEIVVKSHNTNKTESFNKGLEKLANECKEMESYNNSNCDKNAPNHVPSIENQIVEEKVEKTVLDRKCFSSFEAGLEKLYKELIDEAIVAREKPIDPKVFEEPECEMQPFDRSIQTSIDSIANFQPAALNFSLKSFEDEDGQSQESEPPKPSTVRSFIEISKAYVPQKSRLIEIKPEHNETDFNASTNTAPLDLKTSNTESITKPIKLNFESLAPQKTPNLNVTLEKETSPSVADVESPRQTTKESVDMPQRQNKKEMLEKVEKPVVLPRTRFNYFESGLLKLYKESMDPSNHLQMSDSMMTQDGTQHDAENLPKEGVSLPAYLRPNEDVEANLDLYYTMQATEGQRSESFPSGVNKEDVTEQIDRTAAPTRQPFAKYLEKLQKEAMIEEGRSIGNTLLPEPNPLQRPSISMELTGSDTPTGDTMVDVRTCERRTWRGLSQDEEKPSQCYKPLDSTPVMPNCSSTPINQSNASMRKSTLELFLETPYRREMSKSVDFVLTGYVASEDGKQQYEDEADKLKEQLEGEIPIDTDLKESQFKNPEKLKQLSKSVPAFLHDETDGKDTDSASESSFPIGKHKKSPSSLTDLSGSSGMASMSSVSGSVMSVYSGDFGNVDVKGTIQFAVDYVDQLKEFHVFVSQCKDLAVGDVKKQRSDPYVKSYLYPEKSKMGKRKTAVKKKTLNPAYNEILRYKISKDTLLTQSLNLSVWHNDALGRNSFLGEVELPLDQWDWNNKQMNWYPLQPRTPAAGVGLENRGEIKLSLKYVPQSESGGKSSQTGEVHIWIKDCNQLPQLRGNKINSFVKCTILPDTSRKSRQKTRTVDKTPNPVFNHTMVYDGFKEEDLKEACVELTVWDHNKLTNHFLGGLRIGLGTGKSYGTAVDWMDSSTEESSMWEKMIKDSNIWIDGVLPLRMLKMAKITK